MGRERIEGTNEQKERALRNRQIKITKMSYKSYLKSRKKLTHDLSKHPVATECIQGSDWQGSEAHHDVGHRHVDQVHSGVQPDVGGPA